jgi:hypothetical protein
VTLRVSPHPAHRGRKQAGQLESRRERCQSRRAVLTTCAVGRACVRDGGTRSAAPDSVSLRGHAVCAPAYTWRVVCAVARSKYGERRGRCPVAHAPACTPRHRQHAASRSRSRWPCWAAAGETAPRLRGGSASPLSQVGIAAVPAHAMVEWLTACETSERLRTAMLGTMRCRFAARGVWTRAAATSGSA